MANETVIGLPALFYEDSKFFKDVYFYGDLFIGAGSAGIGALNVNKRATFRGPVEFYDDVFFYKNIEVFGQAGFRSDVYIDKEILNLRVGILTVSQRLDVGLGGTTLTGIASYGKVGIGSSSPEQKLDVAGSVKIDEFIYDSANSSGISGYYLNMDERGIRWIAGTPRFTQGIYVQDEGVYIPRTGVAQSFTVLNFKKINSYGIGTDTVIPIPNPNNPNFIANIQTQDYWGHNDNNDIYRLTNVGIGNSYPSYSLDISGTLHVTDDVYFDSTLDVDGDTTLNATLDVDGATTLNDTLDVDGDTTLNATLDVDGATTLNSTLDVDGDTTLNATLDVDGATTLNDTLDVDGATTLNNTLTVSNESVFNGTVELNSSLIDINQSTALGKFDYRLSSVGTGVSWRPPGVQTQNAIWVTMDGNDNNSGYLEGDAKRTIGAAAAVAQEGDTIFIRSGVYYEDNPIGLRTDVSVSGQDLRLVTVIPNNPTKDVFHVRRGCLIENLSFAGTSIGIAHTGAGAVAFPPTNPSDYSVSGYIYPGPATEGSTGRWKSPYIRNCTNFMTKSIGMKIDGNHATASSIGADLKCMVCDSFTQYNENGIGVSITNNGYAQLVSIFTINCDIAIYAASGGSCDLTNSNSSFGNYGLVAVGLGSTEFTGRVGAYPPSRSQLGVEAGSDKVTFLNVSDNLCNPRRPYDGQALFFKIDLSKYPDAITTGLSTTILQQPMVRVDSIKVINGGSGYSAATPPNVIIIDSSDNSQQPKGPQGIIAEVSPTIDPATGSITAIDVVNSGRNYLPTQNLTVFIDGSGGAQAEVITQPIYYSVDTATVPTPPPGRYADAVSLITKNLNFIASEAVDRMLYYYNVTLGTPFNVPTGNDRCAEDIRLVLGSICYNLQFGGNDKTYDAAKIYVNNSYLNGEEAQSIVAFNYARDVAKQIINNVTVTKQNYSGFNSYSQIKDLTITADPSPSSGSPSNTNPNSCTDVKNTIDTLFSIITTAINPASNPRLPLTRTSGSTVGVTTITFNEFIPYELFGDEEISLKRISRILTSSHSFEYIGTGTDINTSTPFKGAVPIKANEIVALDGAQVPFTSTDQKGNFDIGEGFQINQPTATIRGRDFSKAIQAEVTPLILALR